jgi:hypothetical protein
VTFTLECSGNHGFPFVIGAIGNARWAGTPLAPLLQRAGVHELGTEVVFWGADADPVDIRDNSGVVRSDPAKPASPEPTSIDLTIAEQFARSMSLEEAMSGDDHVPGRGGWRDRSGFAWGFWTLDWGRPSPGEHTIRSRAFDVDGNVRPAPDDPYVASRVTFWENNGQIARRVEIPATR